MTELDLPQDDLCHRRETLTDRGRALRRDETIEDQIMQMRAGAGALPLQEAQLLLQGGLLLLFI